MALVRIHGSACVRGGLILIGLSCVWSLDIAPCAAQGVPPATAGPRFPTPPANAPPLVEEQVVDVQVKGNRAISTAKVLQNISTRAGRPFDQSILEKDVRKLATKGWFLDVKTQRQPVQGGVSVTFEVVERPTLQYVKYWGCGKISETKLAKQTELKKRDALDPYAVEEGRRKIEAFYQQKGYNNVRVTILEGNKVGDRGAIYLINEGQPQKIWSVKFEGNTIASGSRLKTQIQSKPPILMIFKGYVDRKKIDEDIERLTAYYRSLGYFKAHIGRELEFNEEQKWLTLTFVIDEGPRYVIRNVSLLGNKKFGSEQFTKDLKLAQGQFFNQAQMNADVGVIRDLYGSQGYIFADVQAEPRFQEEPGQLDLVYNITEGDRYRVGKINVRVNGEYAHTRHNTVLNRLSLKPGDIIDIRQVRASERRLKASSLFVTNPAEGAPPRITLSPPELEGTKKSSVAGRSGNPDSFRGQSPDAPSRDRLIDINLDYDR